MVGCVALGHLPRCQEHEVHSSRSYDTCKIGFSLLTLACPNLAVAGIIQDCRLSTVRLFSYVYEPPSVVTGWF